MLQIFLPLALVGQNTPRSVYFIHKSFFGRRILHEYSDIRWHPRFAFSDANAPCARERIIAFSDSA